MVAALSMYDMPHQTEANDALWHAIRHALGHGPQRLSRDVDLWNIWTDPQLVLAQTCGLPYRAHLFRQVSLVSTPDYGLPDCAPGYYCSVLVMQKNGPQTLSDCDAIRFAYNDGLSQSGWNAPQAYLHALGVPIVPLSPTGSHLESARAVAEGRADLASLDAVTWRNLCHACPALVAGLQPVAHTDPTPGLPLITGQSQDPDKVANAVRLGFEQTDPGVLAALGLRGLVQIPAAAYLALPLPPEPEAL